MYPQRYQPTLTSHTHIYIYTFKLYLHDFTLYIWIYVALMFRWSQLLQPCPAAGTFEMAAKPLGTSANFKPADGDK